jgi:hypothetical protein
MLVFGIALLSKLLKVTEVSNKRFPFFHFTVKFMLNLNFFVMMLQVLCATFYTEKLLFAVRATFHIAVVYLNRSPSTLA